MRLSSLNSTAQEPNILHRHTHCKVALVIAVGSSLLGIVASAASIPLMLDEIGDGGSPLQTMDFDQLPLTQWDSVSEVTLSNDSDSVVYDADVGSGQPIFRHTNKPVSTSDDILYQPDALTADTSLESRHLQLSQDNYASWSFTVTNSVGTKGMTTQKIQPTVFSFQEVRIHIKPVPEPSSMYLLSLTALAPTLRRKR